MKTLLKKEKKLEKCRNNSWFVFTTIIWMHEMEAVTIIGINIIADMLNQIAECSIKNAI